MAAVSSISVRRHLWGLVLLSVAFVMLAPGTAQAAPGVPVPPEDLLLDKGNGEVSDADRDFVTKVRLAGLWEIPAGKMALQKSDSARIKSIGRNIASQHVTLDKLTRDAAESLDIELPDEPNEDQQGWLDEMEAAEGREFDKIYIDRLRAAHGKIFPAIATIRASTRNDTVRILAQQANQFVMTHLTLLESSGIVDFKALPTAPPPSPVANQSQDQGQEQGQEQELAAGEQTASGTGSGSAGLSTPVLIAVLVGGLIAGGFATWHFAGRRQPAYRSRRPRGYGA